MPRPETPKPLDAKMDFRITSAEKRGFEEEARLEAQAESRENQGAGPWLRRLGRLTRAKNKAARKEAKRQAKAFAE